MENELAQLFTPQVRRIADAFRAKGFELRVIGGAVRDVCLGRAFSDLDLATDCPKDDIGPVCVAAGLKAKAIYVGVVKKEITVWHIYVDDMTAPFDVVYLKHSSNVSTDLWFQDASSRDFTINAMSANDKGTLFDYYNGRQHAQERRVYWIGDITDRILEAPNRLVRYFRFHGEALNNFGREVPGNDIGVGFHDPAVLAEMRKHVRHIQNVAANEQRELLFKILTKSGRFAIKPELQQMFKIGLLELLFPAGVTMDLDEADIVRCRQEAWSDKYGVKVSPLLTVAALLRWDKSALHATIHRWGCSIHESLEFCDCVCETRIRFQPTLEESWCRLWAVDGFKWRRNNGGPMPEEVKRGRDWLQQLLLIHNQTDKLDRVQTVPVPSLPAQFDEMQKFLVRKVGKGLQGRDAVAAMKELRYCFINLGCAVSADRLLETWLASSAFGAPAQDSIALCDELDLALQFYSSM